MTKLTLINYIVQFLFIRITRCEDKVVTQFNLQSVSLMRDGKYSTIGTPTYTIYWWHSIQYWILPLSGWFNTSFIYLNKTPQFKKLQKRRYKVANNQ